MYKINLIRGWQKTNVYRSYRNQIVIGLATLVFALVAVYAFLFVRFLILQGQLTKLSNEQFLKTRENGFSTEDLTKTLYSLRKLEQVALIYNDYPEFYLYHNFLLKKILKFSSLEIEKYNLNRSHQVEVSVRSQQLDDLFELIYNLEDPSAAKYFATFEVNSLSLVRAKEGEDSSYLLDFVLQFNNRLLNEKG